MSWTNKKSLNNINNDLRLLKYQAKFGTYFGICPFDFDSNSSNISRKRKLYFLFLALIFTFWIFFSMHIRSEYLSQARITQKLIDAIASTLQTTFLLSIIIFGNFYYDKNWKQFIATVNAIDTYLLNKGYQILISLKKLLICGLSVYTMLFGTMIYNHFNFNNDIERKLTISFIYYHVILFYEFYVFYMILNMMNFYRIRYKFLNCIIEKIFFKYSKDNKEILQTVDENIKNCMMQDMLELKRTFRLLHSSITEFCKIFGWPIFLLVIRNVTLTLYAINTFLLAHSQNGGPSAFEPTNFFFAMFQTVSLDC